MASSLTGIFAPGSSPLVESLRTLDVEPRSAVAPGELVAVSFTFSNLGGAPATGVRVRFSHPQGAAHDAEADEVDGTFIGSDGHLTDANGAALGVLNPGEQRRVTAKFRVNDTVEDGTLLVFQAALVTDQTPLIGTNVERVRVRSTPNLQNGSTFATIDAPESVRPGDALTVRAVIANTGSSSAHDVVAILPVPDFTSFVARSARIDGRLLSSDREPFDYASSTIVAETLPPGRSVTLEYQVVVDSPLLDGARVRAIGTVASAETPEFGVQSSEIVVHSPGDFDGDETTFTVLSDEIVTPGVRVPLILRATNAGTGIAQNVSIAFTLPSGLVYAPGSAHVDGQPVSDDAVGNLQFSLGTLAAGRVVEAGITATVVVPSTADASMNVEASLRWKGGSRAFSRRLTVRVAPRFTRSRNYIEADRGVAQAAEDVSFTAHVYNDGTAAEHDISLRVIPGPYLEALRIAETGGETMPYDGPLELGIVEPHAQRSFTILARVAGRVPDRSNITLGAALERQAGTVDLGTASVVVRSRPTVAKESLAWELASHQALRPGTTTDVVVRFTNSGTDMLRDARLSWQLPPEIVVERAVDARRERDGLHFGDVPAQSTHEARVTLRLLRAPEPFGDVQIAAALLGRGISPLQFPTLVVPTFAEPNFENARLAASPSEAVNAGDRLSYELRIRNEGDGAADRLLVRVVPTNLAVYIPATTTINGVSLPDDSGYSPLWSGRGLNLADVNPGIDLRIRFEMIVMSPLAAGTALDTRAVLEWNGKTLAVPSPTLRVQAQPSLAETIEGTAFSVARLFAPALQAPEPSAEAPSESPEEPAAAAPVYERPQFADEAASTPEAPAASEEALLPPQIAAMIAEHAETLHESAVAPDETPVEEAPSEEISGVHEAATVTPSVQPEQTAHEPTSEEPVASTPTLAPILVADFTPDRLDNTIKMLERSDAGGLISHLFALRLLMPDTALGAPPQVLAAFATATRAMRAPLERFFVRLRMPRLTISGKDLEDRESRTALQTLLDELVFAPAALPARPDEGTIRLYGSFDASSIRSLAGELETAPLGSVIPWSINVALLGDTIAWDGGQSAALAAYRRELNNVFSVLTQLPIDEFHRVLSSSVNRSLDERLHDVLEALRGAVHAPHE